ncbi:MAG: aconitase X [Pseudomonadota bacterium]
MRLSEYDQECLAGQRGKAARFALSLLRKVGEASGADQLIDVTRAHLVGAYDAGAANDELLDRLARLEAKVRIPTTLNASSACLAVHAPGDKGEQDRARGVVDRYVAMGCRPTLTCAPYHLVDAPEPGECIAWSESNAVVYANSVLGARTNHTVQFLDLCAALTGRIPRAGLYCTERRLATLEVDVRVLQDERLRAEGGFALLGLWLGRAVPAQAIPLLSGLPEDTTRDELRALGAAAAAAGSLAMFHALGLTPEAPDRETATGGRRVEQQPVTVEMLEQVASGFTAPIGARLAAVCLGTPHSSLEELRWLADALELAGHTLRIPLFVSTSRHVMALADAEDLPARLRAQRTTLLTDTCTYYGQVVPGLAGTVMTDSAKWAWYGGNNLPVQPVLAGRERCVASALAGRVVAPEAGGP